MKKREAEFTSRLRKWLLATVKDEKACAYEVKATTGLSIPFSAVSPHQIDALTAVRDGTFVYKIPDAGWQNPFDMFLLSKQEAWIVLAFLESRKRTKVWFIDVDVFKTLQESSKRKSLTHDSLLQAQKEYGYWCRYVLL